MSPSAAGIVVSSALLATSALARVKFSRAIVADWPEEWLQDPGRRAEYEAVMQQTWYGGLLDRRSLPWAMALVVVAVAFAAAEFSYLFVLLMSALLAAWWAVSDAGTRWAKRMADTESIGPPTRRTRRGHAATTALDFLWGLGYFALLGSIGYALADGLSLG